MGNKVVAAALVFVKRNPKLTSFDEFLAGFANLPRRAPPPCVEREIENLVGRIFAKRLGDAPKEKKRPLTSFIVPSINCHGVASFAYRSFNPTKGWRSTTLDAAEAKLHRDNGGLLLAGLPLRRPGRAPTYRRVA